MPRLDTWGGHHLVNTQNEDSHDSHDEPAAALDAAPTALVTAPDHPDPPDGRRGLPLRSDHEVRVPRDAWARPLLADRLAGCGHHVTVRRGLRGRLRHPADAG